MIALAMPLLAPFFAGAHAGDSSWTRWGGPTGDFKVVGPELVEAWPESGPRRLWEIELGSGYSAVLCRGDRLYTAYSEEENEIVVALDRKDGALVWDYAYEAGRYPDMTKSFGEGPNATPLLIADRLVTIGITGKVTCLRADSGDPALGAGPPREVRTPEAARGVRLLRHPARIRRQDPRLGRR